MTGIILRPRRPKFPRKFYDRLRQIQKMHAGEDTPVPDPALWAGALAGQPIPKVPINIRVDADVLRFFKRKGRGYQTRMNAVLRAFMCHESGSDQP